MTVSELIDYGFTRTEAEALVSDTYFHHKTKTAAEIRALMQKIAEVYGCDEAAVKKAVLRFPQFVSYDHERAVREATIVYGDEAAVKKAVLRFPQFASLDHELVVRERIKLGRLVGLSPTEVIQKILTSPDLSSYSAKRYIAGLDCARSLGNEGFTPNPEMLKIFFRNAFSSPYVPGETRKRISQCPTGSPEPPLLKKMRKALPREKP